jgi:hypothetical protein
MEKTDDANEVGTRMPTVRYTGCSKYASNNLIEIFNKPYSTKSALDSNTHCRFRPAGEPSASPLGKKAGRVSYVFTLPAARHQGVPAGARP